MACLEMYNSDEHKQGHQYNSCAPMSPRISFSNDFVEMKPDNMMRKGSNQVSSSSSSSSDFEFSVTNYSMMTADELFFKGKLLPFKETNTSQGQRTLREELLVEEEGPDDEFTLKPSKGRWKGFLGLKRAHIGSKKAEKSHEESKRAFPGFAAHEETISTKASQEILGDGDSSNCGDVEIGI